MCLQRRAYLCSATNVYASVSANKKPTVLIARFSYLNDLKEFERCLCILTAERRLLKKNYEIDIFNFPFKFMCRISL